MLIDLASWGAPSLRAPRTIVARLFFALALIVQIIAPVASSVAMVTAATDPLIGIVVCGEDLAILDRQSGDAPLLAHHGDACALCQLVAGDGFAPPPVAPARADTRETTRAADWGRRVEPVVATRLLDHIRGRAPPIFS